MDLRVIGQVGDNDRFICFDDSHKVDMGREKYLRLAFVEFEKGEDLAPYNSGDRHAFDRKVAEGKMRQYDLIIDSWDPDEDRYVAEVAKKAISEMSDGGPVDLYACFFFEPYLEGEYKDIVFASGHRPNRYKDYVHAADMATTWEREGEGPITGFIHDLEKYWRASPGVRANESFEFEGRTVLVSDRVRRKYGALAPAWQELELAQAA